MKKITALLLCLLFLAGSLQTSFAAEEPPLIGGMPNPMNEYGSLADILEEYPEMEMEEPPEGASDIFYYVIDSGDGYPIGEIDFVLNGIEYCYRCSTRYGEPHYTADMGYLAGLYYDFDVNETEKVDGTNVFTEMTVHYCTAESIGCVEWFDSEAVCDYSVSASAPLATLKETARSLAEKNIRYATVNGTVLAVTEEKLTVRLNGGNIINFPLYIDTEARTGDYVSIDYTGTLLSDPYILNISVLYAADVFRGTVTSHDASSVTVEASNGTKITFALTEYTAVTGEDSEIKNNAQVHLTYYGSLADTVYAYEICIDVPGEEMDPSLIDKTLKGKVIKLTSKYLQIETSKGRKYKFMRVRDTEYTGKYDLKAGCTVVVTYDGYASKAPDAKIVKVTAAAPKPDPTPQPTKKLKKVEGIVTSVCGIWITLDDGKVYTVNTAHCEITGPDYVMEGARATFYFYKSGKDRIVERATFEIKVY